MLEKWKQGNRAHGLSFRQNGTEQNGTVQSRTVQDRTGRRRGSLTMTNYFNWRLDLKQEVLLAWASKT